MSDKVNDIKGLCFDKDGTLFDFSATWEAWAQSFLLRLSGGDRAKAAQAGKAIGFDFVTTKFARDSIATPDQGSDGKQQVWVAQCGQTITFQQTNETPALPQS